MEVHIEILKLTLFIIVSHHVLKKVQAFVSGWLGILPRSAKPETPSKETEEEREVRELESLI